MKRILRIILLVLTGILFITTAIFVLGICMDAPMPFLYLLDYTLTITFGVGLFVLGLFGLCKLGDWAFKKD